MRTLREEDHLRAQPELLPTSDEPGISPEPAESYCLREWETGAKNLVRQVHSDAGEDGLIEINPKFRQTKTPISSGFFCLK